MSRDWNEIRAHARDFAQKFANVRSEVSDKQTFYNAFFDIFGIERQDVAEYESLIKKEGPLKGRRIDLLWPEVLLIEHKSAGGNLVAAAEQADKYREALEGIKPTYRLVSDFRKFELLNWKTGKSVSFELDELPDYVESHFGFMHNPDAPWQEPKVWVDVKATKLMAGIYDALKESGYPDEYLAMFLVRLVFILFADNTGIFPRSYFLNLLATHADDESFDVGDRIHRIFETLNQTPSEREKNLPAYLEDLPYVNGKLFEEPIRVASFNEEMRKKLIEAAGFNWAKVSPAVFGSLFQSVMDPVERRHIGAHYTTEANIIKVMGPLFLDDLLKEFERLKRLSRRAKQLEEFRRKLAGLKFLDPACGCGNFLIIAYRELRKLELEILKALKKDGQLDLMADSLSLIDVDQFHGIELESFPAHIAEAAMWMMDHIMNNEMSETFGRIYTRIPLRKSPHILCADALETDWSELLPAKECSFVLGNPPFGGSKYQDPAQRRQVREIAGLGEANGTLDHVAAWFAKAGEYAREGRKEMEIAFVATNSICQGEQVGQLWPILFHRFNLEISFAHRTFEWNSEAPGKAHVHCVIVGLMRNDKKQKKKRLFSYPDPKKDHEETTHDALSPYLFDAALLGNRHLTVKKAKCPINGLPPLTIGSKPIDDGNYIFTDEGKDEFLKLEPGAEPFLRPFVGAWEHMHGERRWILALQDAQPQELTRLPQVMSRMKAVEAFRSRSKSGPTKKLAKAPTQYHVNILPEVPFLMIPRVSSEQREYVPIAWLEPPVIPSDSSLICTDAQLHHFGLLTSAMHMAWLRNIGGRLKSDYRYSAGIVYNTFPVPEMSAAKKERIGSLARAVLEARAHHPDSTLADLYNSLAMPLALRKAHSALDRAVDRLYRRKRFERERERVEHLLMLYERMTAPVIEAAAPPKHRRRKKV